MLKADIFNSSDQNTILTNFNSLSSSALPPSYPSEKHNILVNPAPPPPPPTTTTNNNTNNNNTNSSANEKETVTKSNINHVTSNTSPASQVKQSPLIASQPIKINYREDNKDRRAKQLDLKHLTSEKIQSKLPMNAETTNTNEPYYIKSQSTQNSQPSGLCMSPRCPPDGAAFHEISPSNLSKSKKSVIYENLIDRYLLVEKNEYLKKELMTQQALTTTTTTTTTVTSNTTNTVTNNNTSTISNHPLTTKITDCSTQKVPKLQEKLPEVSEKNPEVIPHTSSGVANDKNNVISNSINHFPSPKNQTSSKPLSSSNVSNWFPPPPPPPLQDSMIVPENLDSKAPHYHEHCRPDEVHSSLINTGTNKPLSSNTTNLETMKVAIPELINPLTQINTSIPSSNFRLPPSPPTPPLPPPSTPPGPPSVPPRHPATTLQHKTLQNNSSKVTSEQVQKPITSENLNTTKSNEPVSASSVSPILPVSQTAGKINIPNVPNQLDQTSNSSVIQDSVKDNKSDPSKHRSKSHSVPSESKVPTTSACTKIDENNRNLIKYPPDGRSVVPWDFNQEDTTPPVTSSSSSTPMKSCRTDEMKMTESLSSKSQPSTISSSLSFPDRNVIWANSQLPISSHHPSEKSNSQNIDSIDSVKGTQQSKKSTIIQEQNAKAVRPNCLSQFMVTKSAGIGHPSSKRLLSPDDLKSQHRIRKHLSVTNATDLNHSILLESDKNGEFVHLAYPINDPTVFSHHHNKEFLINSHSDMQHLNHPAAEASWLKAQQRAELMNTSKSRNAVRRSGRDFSQRQFSAEPVFVNKVTGVMHLSPSITHKEQTQYVTSRIPSTTHMHNSNNNILLMTQSSLPSGFPEQQPDFFIHYRHKSDNPIHTNSHFITGDSTHQQYYRQRNRSHNSDNSCMTESMAPSYDASMTQSVFFPLDSGWGPPEVKQQSESTSGNHKKHRSNVNRSHSQRIPDSHVSIECNQLSLNSDQSRCFIPSKYYFHQNSSQTVPVNPEGNSIWPPVLVQWRRRRPNGAVSSENFTDVLDFQNTKRYNENMHIPVDQYGRQKSEILQRHHHHYSTTAISEQLENQLWFHHDLPRSQAEKLLKTTPTGSFLVRRSETSKTELSLSIKRENDVLHMKISQDPETGAYVLGEYSQPYPSVSAMIYRYSRSLLPVRGTTPVLLRFPVSRIAFSH
ncbi:unnamed protein product [Trichobilharzia szidati]|nr:unnamed protein product [Trichobilharzia szidati]